VSPEQVAHRRVGARVLEGEARLGEAGGQGALALQDRVAALAQESLGAGRQKNGNEG